MLTEEDRRDIDKRRFISGIESDIEKLDFQHKRIFEFSLKTCGNPDADYYMILLRRLYRIIESEQHDSRVGNLKGKFSNIHKKIKIRDHFEHEVDLDNFPHASQGIIVIGGVVINKTNPHIISGNQKWLLNEDHEKFKDLMRKFANLYPFASKPKKKVSFICRLLKKLTNKYCNNR
jgi:hypothetical protein